MVALMCIYVYGCMYIYVDKMIEGVCMEEGQRNKGEAGKLAPNSPVSSDTSLDLSRGPRRRKLKGLLGPPQRSARLLRTLLAVSATRVLKVLGKQLPAIERLTTERVNAAVVAPTADATALRDRPRQRQNRVLATEPPSPSPPSSATSACAKAT